MKEKDKSTEYVDCEDLSTEHVAPAGGFKEGDAIPESFGSFEIVDLIHKSMGIVYKARQKQPDRTVALKIPVKGKLLTREERAEFEKEIAMAASLVHSAIVPVLETGVVQGSPYYTMPYIEGRDLFSQVRVECLSWQERLDLFCKVCRAVQSLHEHHLLHRDLKPNNILIDRYGDVRILDFGLAKAVENPALDKERVIAGTVQFMAPEQTSGKTSSLTPACDVYALGVMLYWMTFDRLPYDVSGMELEDAVKHICSTEIPFGPPVDPAAIPALPVVRSCLSRNPSGRPRDAASLLHILQRSNNATTTGPTVPTSELPEHQIPHPSKGIKNLAVIFLGAGLLLIAGAWLLSTLPSVRQNGNKPLPTPPQQTQVLALTLNSESEDTADAEPSSEHMIPPDSTIAGSVLSPTVLQGDADNMSVDEFSSRIKATLRATPDLQGFGAVLLHVDFSGELEIVDPDGAGRQRIHARTNRFLALFLPSKSGWILHYSEAGQPMKMTFDIRVGEVTRIHRP